MAVGSTSIHTLIKLLDEPDEKAYRMIREKIYSIGVNALPSLEKARENNFDPLVQDRIRDISRHLRRESLSSDFREWVRTGAADLLKGFILVSKLDRPELDDTDVFARIEQIRLDIWLELHDHLTALENVRVINHILFNVYRFEGNKENLSAPENSNISTFLESRKGSPLSLGMLYIILAGKLGLPIHGVNLPQHFILAYLTDPGLKNPTEDNILFYINPFNMGTVFTRREIELFIGQMKVKPERSFFTPCSNLVVVRQLISNLVFAHNHSGDSEKSEDFQNLLEACE